jgi:hypothetical protein
MYSGASRRLNIRNCKQEYNRTGIEEAKVELKRQPALSKVALSSDAFTPAGYFPLLDVHKLSETYILQGVDYGLLWLMWSLNYPDEALRVPYRPPCAVSYLY